MKIDCSLTVNYFKEAARMKVALTDLKCYGDYYSNEDIKKVLRRTTINFHSSPLSFL